MILATRHDQQVAIFRGLGLTVVYMASADSLDQVYEQIALLGALTGREAEAEALIADMQSRIAAVTERLAGVESGPRVFYELTNDLYTAAPNTFVGALLETLKAQNVAAGAASQFPQLSTEAVIAADPEVVLLTDGEFGESLQTVAARQGWSAVSAVVNGRVYPVDGDLTRPRPAPAWPRASRCWRRCSTRSSSNSVAAEPRGHVTDTAGELTPAWLTDALRGDGVLGDGAVAFAKADQINVGQGFAGRVFRVAVTYEGAPNTAPRTLIAKLPASDPGARTLIDGPGYVSQRDRVLRRTRLGGRRAYAASLFRGPGSRGSPLRIVAGGHRPRPCR